MASIVVSGDTSGAITISAPSVAGTNTLTLPANTGTVITTASTFGATGPAFRAYQSATSTLTSGAWNKVTYTNTTFDTNSCYSTSTSRFTPTVAGYYQINSVLTSNAAIAMVTAIYKNASQVSRGWFSNPASVGGVSVSGLVYCNGSTDYIEICTYNASGSTTTDGTGNTWVDGFLARAA